MTEFKSTNTRAYTTQDVQQILHRAIARQADDKQREFSHEQLLEIAAELEITPQTLKLAEDDWLLEQSETQQRLAFNNYRQSRFKRRLGSFTIINTILILTDLVAGGGLGWSLYILLFSGMGVSLNAWNVFHTQGEDYEMAFQRWYRKHQFKKSFNNLINKFLKATSA